MRRVVIATIIASAALVACDSNERGTGDAPILRYDDTPADIINMPNGYGNVATKCVPYQRAKRVYIPTHNKSDVQPVIVDDPTCGDPK